MTAWQVRDTSWEKIIRTVSSVTRPSTPTIVTSVGKLLELIARSLKQPKPVLIWCSQDLSYKEKHWHESCFQCSKCSASLVDQQFGSKADRIYCGSCYDAQFAARCDSCKDVFKAGMKKMEYKTRQWHEKCFVCCTCNTIIGTKSFIPKENEIYCTSCYEDKFATKCVKCNKVCIGKAYNVTMLQYRSSPRAVWLTGTSLTIESASPAATVTGSWLGRDSLLEMINLSVLNALHSSFQRDAMPAPNQLQVITTYLSWKLSWSLFNLYLLRFPNELDECFL